MMKKLWLIMLIALGGLCQTARADVVTEWNGVALNSIQNAMLTSGKAARALAMTHGAMFDAINSIDGKYRPFHVAVDAPDPVSPVAAGASAAHGVLVGLFPMQKPALDAALASTLAGVPDTVEEENGIALGEAIAEEYLDWRAGDHANDMVPYTPGDKPGQWRPTPPNYASAMLPGWGLVTPFAVKDVEIYRRAGPPNLKSAVYARDVIQVQALGAKISTLRTPAQSEIARFWVDMPGTPTTAGRWNLVARQVSAARGLPLIENARLFALLNAALADAGIAAFDCKYHFNFWRPITAIREADTDGNRATVENKMWEPLVMTPAFPEYVSAHSTFSAAAAEVLSRFFYKKQKDTFPFTIADYANPAIVRNYLTFHQAANEAGISRIYGGIHFASGNEWGLRMGAKIGADVMNRCMRAAPQTKTKR